MDVNTEEIELEETKPLRGEDRILQLFKKYDKDNSGSISIRELKSLVSSQRNDIPEHIVSIIYQKADSNHDGQIGYEEFVSMLRNPENEMFFKQLFNGYLNIFIPHKECTRKDQGYHDHKRVCSCPPAMGMLLISLLQVILFVIDSSQSDSNPISSVLRYHPNRRREAWRYLTYMCVHEDWSHLVGNLVFQIVLGIPLENIHDSKRIIIIYFLGVIAGSLGTSIINPDVTLVGASGGVYSLEAACMANLILNWHDMPYPLVLLIVLLSRIIADLSQAIYNYQDLHSNARIGYAAHFSGAFAGLLVGIFVLRNFKVTKIECAIKRAAIFVFILFVGIAVISNATWKSHFPNEEY